MMDFQLLTALLLLLLCPSLLTTAADTGLDVVGPSRPVCAIVGEDALFSCHLNPEMNAEDLEVAWSTNTGAALVHMYRHRKDYEDKPEEQFRGRTRMIRTDITRGAVGLVISNITRDDEAEYACGFDHETLPVHGVAEFDLKVAGKSACELEKDLADQADLRSIHEEKPHKFSERRNHFTHKSTIQEHQRVQTGERRFTCSECEKRFTNKTGLVQHQRIHTGEKPFPCTECKKRFNVKSDLQRPIRIHTGEKPFPCTECKKSFTVKHNLQHHLRIHTGEKPFPCTECKKRFTVKRDLQRHLRIHTGEKPFPCTECKKRFTQKAHLLQHLRIHPGVRDTDPENESLLNALKSSN